MIDILNTIPKIEGTTYVGIEVCVSIGQEKGHLVVKFGNEGGGYYPIIIMDDKSQFALESKEFLDLSKWVDKTCKELDKIEKKYEVPKKV